MTQRGIWLGVAGLAGAAVTGLGEGLLQLAPNADYADPGYGYFLQIDSQRQSVGHWLSVLAAPLYLAGYWHLTRNLAPLRPRLANGLYAVMAYAFVLATVWMGQRFFIAETVKAIAAGEANNELLVLMSEHNEPLINALRLAILIFSVLWVWLILAGGSRYPRWMALASPGALLAAIFALYFAAPAVGGWLLPTAMNTTHVILFSLSLLTLGLRGKSSS